MQVMGPHACRIAESAIFFGAAHRLLRLWFSLDAQGGLFYSLWFEKPDSNGIAADIADLVDIAYIKDTFAKGFIGRNILYIRIC